MASKVGCADCGWAGTGNDLTTSPNIPEHCPKCKSERIFGANDLQKHPELLTPKAKAYRAAVEDFTVEYSIRPLNGRFLIDATTNDRGTVSVRSEAYDTYEDAKRSLLDNPYVSPEQIRL